MAARAPEQAESVAAPIPLDRITLTGITGYGYHGVFPAEKERGQPFVVDLTCELNLAGAGAADDLGQTVDYAKLAQAVVADVEGDPLDLIEALADRIAQTCLEYQAVQRVEVTVHKPHAPLPVHVADVAVTLTRSR
jgi:7,8-dihydroneopterin aldolase/epimerase/oxygenase